MEVNHSYKIHYKMVIRPVKSEPVLWGSLPAEIRLMIFKLVTRDRKRGWTSHAAVCKEWQFHIEKENFHQLKLRDSCLDYFNGIRPREHVRHIQFIIQLPEYSCLICNKKVPKASPGQSIIGERIFRLLSILATWKSATGGITFELNAYSPSDSEHCFKHYWQLSDAVDPAKSTQGGNNDKVLPPLHDPEHGWNGGYQITKPTRSAVEEIFQTIDLGSRIDFPQVNVVTCFIIRRQLRRSLRPSDIQRILCSFPQLERMVYEPWKAWSWYRGLQQDLQFTRLLQHGLPKNFRRLSVFQDFNEDIAAVTDPEWSYGSVYGLSHGLNLEYCIDRVCRLFDLNLEEISLSFMVNAEDFFLESVPSRYWEPMPTGPWERLQSLSLTSKLLQPTTNRIDIDALLCRAGVCALRMPKLRTLVLWNGGRKVAAAFIYRLHRNDATITWRGTWQSKFSPQVIEAWRFVASTLHSMDLRIEKKQLIEETMIRSHGDAIYHLDLPTRVVEPASLYQIRKENR